MSAEYFYHSPEGRIYGPADYATLLVWEKEGRLTKESKLRSKNSLDLISWSELPSPPSPSVTSTILVSSPTLLSAEEKTRAANDLPENRVPLQNEEPSLASLPTVSDFFSKAGVLYSRYFPPLVGLSFLGFLPGILFDLWALRHPRLIEPDYVVEHPQEALVILLTALVTLTIKQFVFWTILVFINLREEMNRGSLIESFRSLWSRILPLSWAELLSGVMIAGQLFIALLALASFFGFRDKGHGLVPLLLLGLFLFLMIPVILMWVRWSLVSLVVLFEGRTGMSSLQRSQALATYPGASPFLKSGLWTLFLLNTLPLVFCVTFLQLAKVMTGLGSLPILGALSRWPWEMIAIVVGHLGWIVIAPLGWCLLFEYYRAVSSRMEDL